VVDRLFSDAGLAALYDAFCEGRTDLGFYLLLVMSSKSISFRLQLLSAVPVGTNHGSVGVP
jgi:hypothetical protein